MTVGGEHQLTQRLVTPACVRDFQQRAPGARLSFGKVAVEQQLADSRQLARDAGGHVGLNTARPDRVLVQLDAFGLDAAEHHGAKAAISNRERFDPLGRGVPIPQRGVAPLPFREGLSVGCGRDRVREEDCRDNNIRKRLWHG